MSIEYTAEFHIDLGKAIPAVGEVLDTINNGLSKAGVDERLQYLMEFPSISITVDRELTDEEQYKMRSLIEHQVVKSFPQYDVRLKSFGRKSGNVQQSAV